MEKIEVRIPCEDGEIVYCFYDDTTTKRASFVKLDADCFDIDNEQNALDLSDVSSEWETQLGKDIGEMFDAIDRGVYNEDF